MPVKLFIAGASARRWGNRYALPLIACARFAAIGDAGFDEGFVIRSPDGSSATATVCLRMRRPPRRAPTTWSRPRWRTARRFSAAATRSRERLMSSVAPPRRRARSSTRRAGATSAATSSSATASSPMSAWGAAPAAPDGARSSTAPATCSRPASSTCAPSSASPAPSIARRCRARARRRRRAASRRSCRMPDTNPLIDDPAIVDFVLRRARDTAIVNIRPAAALTKGLAGPRDDRDRPPAARPARSPSRTARARSPTPR